MNRGNEELRPWLLTIPLIRYIDKLTPARLLEVINAFRKERGMAVLPGSEADELWNTGLVHVRVEMVGRGSPGDNAIIYSLDEDERSLWVNAQEREENLGRAGYADCLTTGPVSEVQKVSTFAGPLTGY
jgi:ribonuclease P/MRP protein subunit POP1